MKSGNALRLSLSLIYTHWIMIIVLSYITIQSKALTMDLSPCLNIACPQDQKLPVMITINPDDSNSIDDESCYPLPTEKSMPGNVGRTPCKTINFALDFRHRTQNVVFFLASPSANYPLYNLTTFESQCGICIYGNTSMHPTLPVIKCLGKEAGLSFINTTNVVIEGVKFVHCGAHQNSTSKNLSQSDEKLSNMLTIKVALYFYNCMNVRFHSIVVSDSAIGTTGVVMYNTDGVVSVTKSNFTENCYGTDNEERQYGGGGFAVEFSYCTPGDNECNDTYYDNMANKKNKNSQYSFTDCHYNGNRARGLKNSDFGGQLYLLSNSSHQGIGRGGGLSFFFKGDARNNSINITYCHFVNNSAVWGGGLHIDIDDNTSGNKFLVVGCDFTGNQAFHDTDYGTGGGGILFAYNVIHWNNEEDVKRDSFNFLIENTHFARNSALEGGALQVSITPQSNNDHLVNITIFNSDFEYNQARLGSAVAVLKYQIVTERYMPEVFFANCTLTSNRISYSSEIVHPVGLGAVYIDEVAVQFSEVTLFENNSGSALGITGTQVTFRNNTRTTFDGNEGLNGGAITLLGTAYILVGEQSTMNFFNNHATQHGGALYNHYITRRDLKSSISCFIRYTEPFVKPTDWNVMFHFRNNTSGKTGKSIYSTAVLPCLYGLSNFTPFCWNDSKWRYDSSCKDEIFTEANNFSFKCNSISMNHILLSAYPGKQFHLPLYAWDDLGHNVSSDTVYYAYTNGTPNAKVKAEFSYVANDYISITGSPNADHTNTTLGLQTSNSRMMHVILNLTLLQCPPGFTTRRIEDGRKDNDDKTCNSKVVKDTEDQRASSSQCRCYVDSNDFRGLLKCHEEEFKSSIDTRYWFGRLNESNENNDSNSLLMGYLYYWSSDDDNHSSKDGFVSLPNSTDSLNSFFCEKLNRRGALCGQCRLNYSVAVNSLNYKCVQCNSTSAAEFAGNLFAYIALTYIPIAILFIAIIICNIKLASSAAAGFLLFAQVTSSSLFKSSIERDLGSRSTTLLLYTYRIIYGIFNLESFAFLMKNFCLSKNFTTLHVLCLDYAVAFFPFILILMIYVFYQCKSWKCQLSYTIKNHLSINQEDPDTSSAATFPHKDSTNELPKGKLIHAFVAFLLLSYNKFGLASIKTLIFTDLFNSNHTVMTRNMLAGHLSFSNTSYIPFGVVAVFVLFFFVILPPLSLLGPLQFMDWVTDKHCCRKLRQCWPSITIHTVMDTFQGYKPNRRFFPGIYLLFRLIIFLTSMIDSDKIEFILQQLAISTLTILVALFRPYNKEFYNNLDTLLIFNLGILNLLTMLSFEQKQTMYWLVVIRFVLVYLPLVYVICYALWKTVYKRKKYKTVKKKLVNFVNTVSSNQEEGTVEEHEQLIATNDIFGESIQYTGDEEEDIFRRAERGNRFRPHTLLANIQAHPEGRDKHVVKTVKNVKDSQLRIPTPEEESNHSMSSGNYGITACQTGTGRLDLSLGDIQVSED